MKWCTIIPLIGGMNIGFKKTLNSEPEAIFSYLPFKNNDKLLLNYWNYKNYIVIDEEKNQLPIKLSNIDIVNTVCPCAGLSMLNSSNRGADAEQNDWMYKTAELALGEIQPKVFVGENAPGLFTKLGQPVVDRLRNIGKKYGYVFSMYKVNNAQHGVPQKRIRTFYFFWKGNKIPILPFLDIKYKNMAEYLKDIPDDAIYNNKKQMTKKLADNFLWDFLINNIESDTQLLRKKILAKTPNRDSCTILRFLFHNSYGNEIYKNQKLLNEYAKLKNQEHLIPKISHIINKLEQNLNYWDSSPKIIGNSITAVISKNNFLNIHPTEDRFLTIREHMYLMKLPHDFLLDSLDENKVTTSMITQNVIVETSKNVASWIIDYLNNKLELINANYVKQDSINETTTIIKENINQKTLF